MSDCTHDCSTCGESCADRKNESPFQIKPLREGCRVGKVYGVVSGKGGVGKSMVTSQLAVSVRREGYNVAVLDADITGPSIPKAFGIHGRAMAHGDAIVPVTTATELPDVVRLCETSLQSERVTLDALEEECVLQGKTHRVIVMADLGDLREGFWDKDEMVDVCVHVERELPHVVLAGIGVNLTCYGSTKPTPEKMQELLAIADRIERRIGRKLEIVSGGATSSYTLVHWDTMPERINHLRIGEAILLGKDLQVDWGIRDMDYLRMDTFTLRAEVVEVRDKPTYPIGEFAIDAFGHKPVYEDRGIRRRAILALGRADVGELESLLPREEGITVIGGSSDHCILDVEDCPRRLEVGDVVEFSLCYSHMLYATARSDMHIQFVN